MEVQLLHGLSVVVAVVVAAGGGVVISKRMEHWKPPEEFTDFWIA